MDNSPDGLRACNPARYGQIRRRLGSGPTHPTQRILDARAAIPPGALLAGWAAAYVHGIDALDGLDHLTMKPLPVPVLLPPGLHRQNTPGIRYRQSTRRVRGDLIEGIPVTMLLRTAYDLAREAQDLTEAVVALDAILAARQLKPEHLQDNLTRLDGLRGANQARRAIEFARQRDPQHLGVQTTDVRRARAPSRP